MARTKTRKTSKRPRKSKVDAHVTQLRKKTEGLIRKMAAAHAKAEAKARAAEKKRLKAEARAAKARATAKKRARA
jgi:hypothetical protein